jgi:hypothetical protein
MVDKTAVMKVVTMVVWTVDKMVVKWVDRTAVSSVVLKVEVTVDRMVDVLADPKVEM